MRYARRLQPQARDGGFQQQLEKLGITHARKTGHDRELCFIVPGGIRVDFHQLDRTPIVGTKIETCIVAALQPGKQPLRIGDKISECRGDLNQELTWKFRPRHRSYREGAKSEPENTTLTLETIVLSPGFV